MKNPLWGNIFKKKTSESAEILKLLSSSPVFKNINKNGLMKIGRIIHLRQYTEGEIVFKNLTEPWPDIPVRSFKKIREIETCYCR